MLMFVCLFEGV